MGDFEIIHFRMFGLDLREPMALITNWMISAFCFFAYFRLWTRDEEEVTWWRRFFLILGISTFLGGLGHLFYEYFDKPGKFPNWITGIWAGYFAGNAMLVRLRRERARKALQIVLVIKAAVFLVLALINRNFIFIAVDAIVTYLFFCGIIGLILYLRGFSEMRFMVLGVLVCLPSAFIFLLKVNPHKWLNKDDLSHLLMLGCTICFYLGAKRIGNKLSVTGTGH